MKPARKTIDERFLEFHRANPGVWTLFERWARHEIEVKRQTRVSAKMLFERIRQEFASKQPGCARYALNNDFHSRYVRVFCMKYPAHAAKFEQRALKDRRSAERMLEEFDQAGQVQLRLLSTEPTNTQRNKGTEH